MKNRKTAIIQTEQGSFLVSTLIFIAMISVLIASSWQIVSQRQDKWQKVRILNSRDTVLLSALRNSRVATYYYYTLIKNDPINADFFKCMIGDDGAGSDCIAIDASGTTVQHSVRLLDETYTPVLGEDSTHPVYYDVYGRTCSPQVPSESCPFEVFGSYTVICDTAANSCPQAYDIQMTVAVRVNAAYEHLFPSMNTLTAVQKIAISNFKDNPFPILPPTTPWGAPVTDGAGPGGWIVTAVGGGGAGGGGGGGGGPSGPVSPCGPGKGAKGNGSCGNFSF